MVAVPGKAKVSIVSREYNCRQGGSGRIRVLTPVDLGVPSFIEDLLDDLGVEDFGEVLTDEGKSLGGLHGGHCASTLAKL